MATTQESIKKMLLAHQRRDEAAFRAAVQELAVEEQRKKHPVVAREYLRLLESSDPPHPSPPAPRALQPLDVPRDKDRDAYLLEERVPERMLEDLVLSCPTRARLERILVENRKGDLLRAHSLRPLQKLLFCGPPGCGKTVAAEAIARGLFLPLAIVRFDALISSYLGETAANLRKVFDFARARHVVVLFDEFDAIGKSRADETEHGELKRVVNAFLQLLDAYRGHSVLIASTNHEGLLDPALWRRFDDVIEFPRPTQEEIVTLLVANLRQIGLSRGVKLERQATQLQGLSHADVERVALDAAKSTILAGADEIDEVTLRAAIDRQKDRTRLHAESSQESSGRRRRKPAKE